MPPRDRAAPVEVEPFEELLCVAFEVLGLQAYRHYKGHNEHALIITYNILGVPYYTYSIPIRGPYINGGFMLSKQGSIMAQPSRIQHPVRGCRALQAQSYV